MTASEPWLVTVDPHLHRYPALSARSARSALYTISAETLHAAPLLGDWIAEDVDQPLVIDPDGECRCRVSAIAGRDGDNRCPRRQYRGKLQTKANFLSPDFFDFLKHLSDFDKDSSRVVSEDVLDFSPALAV